MTQNVAQPTGSAGAPDEKAVRAAVVENSRWIRPLQDEMARVIVGQKHLLDRLLIALLTNGHVLLEGVPGLAKTLALKTLANCIAVDFKRLQFTPDMLPADLTGSEIYRPEEGGFRFQRGPLFHNRKMGPIWYLHHCSTPSGFVLAMTMASAWDSPGAPENWRGSAEDLSRRQMPGLRGFHQGRFFFLAAHHPSRGRTNVLAHRVCA